MTASPPSKVFHWLCPMPLPKVVSPARGMPPCSLAAAMNISAQEAEALLASIRNFPFSPGSPGFAKTSRERCVLFPSGVRLTNCRLDKRPSFTKRSAAGRHWLISPPGLFRRSNTLGSETPAVESRYALSSPKVPFSLLAVDSLNSVMVTKVIPSMVSKNTVGA